MRNSEYHEYSAPAKFEVVSDAEKPKTRMIAKGNLGEVSVSNVIAISNRYTLRREAEQLEGMRSTNLNHLENAYNANIDSGESQETIYPHINKLDLPPQSE